jgi:creatinine amidohydrolase
LIKVSIEEMTRTDFKEIQNKIEVAIIPVGSTEQHGPHLPMNHDLASVLFVARRATEKLYPRVVLTPPTDHHRNITPSYEVGRISNFVP